MLVLQQIQYSCVETKLHYKYSSSAYEVISLFLHDVKLGNVAAKNYIKSHIHKTYERPLNTQNSSLKRDYLTHQIWVKQNFWCLSSVFSPKQNLSHSFLWLRSFQRMPKFLWDQTSILEFEQYIYFFP